MNIKQFLDTLAPFDPTTCKVHLATRTTKDDPLEVYCAGGFKQWQEDQNRCNFERPRILSLIRMPDHDRWLFAGVYAVNGRDASATRESGWTYRTTEVPEYSEMNGRLIINFTRPGRQSYLLAEPWVDQMMVQQRLPTRLNSPLGAVGMAVDIAAAVSIGMFAPLTDGPALRKQVGSFQHTDGVRIDETFHAAFNPVDAPEHTPRGHARDVLVLFNNKVFEAKYRYEGQVDDAIHLESIRFKQTLRDEFKKVFPAAEGAFTIALGQDLNHFVFSHEVAVPAAENDDETTYPEGKEMYRLHRSLERNPKVVAKAKARFAAHHCDRLYCEACAMDFAARYGARGQNFIEAHHRIPVAQMPKGHKTKVKDLAMLCANCHRMVHRAPTIKVEDMAAEIVQHAANTASYEEHAMTEGEIIAVVKRFDTDQEFVVSRAFGECGSDPRLARLKRAALNQATHGQAAISRYGIWANTVRDNIRQADQEIDSGNVRKARRLLRRAANAMSAFAELQGHFDTMGISHVARARPDEGAPTPPPRPAASKRDRAPRRTGS